MLVESSRHQSVCANVSCQPSPGRQRPSPAARGRKFMCRSHCPASTHSDNVMWFQSKNVSVSHHDALWVRISITTQYNNIYEIIWQLVTKYPPPVCTDASFQLLPWHQCPSVVLGGRKLCWIEVQWNDLSKLFCKFIFMCVCCKFVLLPVWIVLI